MDKSAKRRGERDYLFLRGEVWWLKYRWPPDVFPDADKRRVEKSLGTKDRAEAEAIAKPQIDSFKLTVDHWRATHRATASRHVQTGFIQVPRPVVQHADGTASIATENWIIHLDQNGEPTGKYSTNRRRKIVFDFANEEDKRAHVEVHDRLRAGRPKTEGPDGADLRDMEILDRWFIDENIKTDIKRETMRVYRDFRRISNNMTLETASIASVKALGAYYMDQGNLPVSAVRKVRWLSTALRHGKSNLDVEVTRNVFQGFKIKGPAKDGRKSLKILPFDEPEMARWIAHIPLMKEQHQLLARLVSMTGMRPSEAVNIASEQLIGGIRCVEIGEKVPSSHRIIPLPEPLLKYLPERITQPLFASAPLGDDEKMRRYQVHRSNEMCAYVRAVGISDPAKRFYSLRHRAITILTNKRCPIDICLEIVGHDESIGVHRKYIFSQSAYPKADLAKWMEAIWQDYDW